MSTELHEWVDGAILRHQLLNERIKHIIVGLLESHNVEFLSVSGRTKTQSSIIEKIERKKYTEYKSQITDISGIRIIVYLESQIAECENIIKKAFSIDRNNSIDRSTILGSDRIGYRSVHYVCSLGDDRSSLLEYQGIHDLKFEVQIRTVLQHAWAELAHDRSFKFKSGLPVSIERKLNLYAGMLEIVDQSFDNISREIDDYVASIKDKDIDGLLGLEISEESIKLYFSRSDKIKKLLLTERDITREALNEMRDFGLKYISDLDIIIDDNYIKSYNDSLIVTNYLGFVRKCMMFHDIDKYFNSEFDWKGIDRSSVNFLAKKYGIKKVNTLLESSEIHISDG